MLFDTHDGHIAMETLINPSAVRVLTLWSRNLLHTVSLHPDVKIWINNNLLLTVKNSES